MSATIYEKTANALIPQADRVVNTFPSGLVRVDQSYIGVTTAATTHRATLDIGETPPNGDDAGTLEGLSIFPKPHEITRGDGFTEYKVSSYGRTTSDIQRSITQPTAVFVRQTAFQAIIPTIRGEVAIQNGDILSMASLGFDYTDFAPIGMVSGNTSIIATSITEGTRTYNSLIGRYLTQYSIAYINLDDATTGTVVVYVIDPEIVIESYTGYGDYAEVIVTATPQII